jgi:hypothetical protein
MATITKLSAEETRESGFTHKVALDYTDFTALTSGTDYPIFPRFNVATNFPALTRVVDITLRVRTAFVFAPGTLVAQVGDTGSAARYIAAATDIKAAAVADPTASSPHGYLAADRITIRLTAGAGALSSITAGALDLFLSVSDISKL